MQLDECAEVSFTDPDLPAEAVRDQRALFDPAAHRLETDAEDVRDRGAEVPRLADAITVDPSLCEGSPPFSAAPPRPD